MRVELSPSPHLYPFESRWFDSQVGPVHYVDEGEGRPILFLHGNPTWSFLYRDVITRLRDDFRCLAVDYPGFGLSEHPEGYDYTAAEHAEVVCELVESLDLDDVIVMGQDWGGPIGLWAACQHVDRVSGLVFGNTWFWPTDRWRQRVFSRAMSSSLGEWTILEQNIFVEKFLPLGTRRTLSEEEMHHYRAVLPRTDARLGVAKFAKQLTEAADWLRELARRVEHSLADLPLLLTWGMRDPAFEPDHFLPRWQSTFADSTTVELPEASHFIQEDAPGAIADAIQAKFG